MKIKKTADEIAAENAAIKVWPIGDDEFEGTHVAEGMYPHEYRAGAKNLFLAGLAHRDAEIAKLKEENQAFRETLTLIANEDYRGNRPQSSVSAYKILQKFPASEKE